VYVPLPFFCDAPLSTAVLTRAPQEERMVSNREAAEKYASVEEAEDDFM
jgi:hypothetical protein